MSQRIKSGQSVNGMVDADGDTWYQAPGNNDMIGYTKPDGTQCTIEVVQHLKNNIMHL